MLPKTVKCDLLKSGADFIVHQVNCQRTMGAGLAKQIKERFPAAFVAYMNNRFPRLGQAQIVPINQGGKAFNIVNLYGQDRYGYRGNRYTNYEGFYRALEDFKYQLYESGITIGTIAFPYMIGCDRGGADWSVIQSMICSVFNNTGYEMLICKLR